MLILNVVFTALMDAQKPIVKSNDGNIYENVGMNQALDVTLNTSELDDFYRDATEIGLDSFFNEGLLKEIPVVKTLYSVWKFAHSVSDAVFLKKLYGFLFELQYTTVKQRHEIISKIEDEEEYANKVSEALVVIIDRLDDTIKPSIIGRLFKAVVEEHIDYQNFLRLAHTVNMCFGLDLIRLGRSWNGNDVNKYNTDQFLILNITDSDYAAIYDDAKLDREINLNGENVQISQERL